MAWPSEKQVFDEFSDELDEVRDRVVAFYRILKVAVTVASDVPLPRLVNLLDCVEADFVDGLRFVNFGVHGELGPPDYTWMCQQFSDEERQKNPMHLELEIINKQGFWDEEVMRRVLAALNASEEVRHATVFRGIGEAYGWWKDSEELS